MENGLKWPNFPAQILRSNFGTYYCNRSHVWTTANYYKREHFIFSSAHAGTILLAYTSTTLRQISPTSWGVSRATLAELPSLQISATSPARQTKMATSQRLLRGLLTWWKITRSRSLLQTMPNLKRSICHTFLLISGRDACRKITSSGSAKKYLQTALNLEKKMRRTFLLICGRDACRKITSSGSAKKCLQIQYKMKR